MKQKTSNCTWPCLAWRLPWLLLIFIGLWLPKLAESYPQKAEWYAEKIYPVIAGILGFLSSIWTFSLVEFILYGTVLGAVVSCLVYLLLWIRKRIPLANLVSFFMSLAIAGGVILNAFYLTWGFNYARPTLYQILDLPLQERPADELKELCDSLCMQAASLRLHVSEDKEGVFTLPDGWRAYFRKIPQAYEALGQEITLFSQRVYPAKGVVASEGMSYAGIAGIYIPYTAEANVNVHQPALLLLSSAAHETAHYLGVAKEDEANFVAYLACTKSDDPAIAYSGIMLALIHCMNKLREADPVAFLEVRQKYSDAMVRDIRQYNAYWEAYDGAVQEAVDNMNDAYLKHNQQENGVRSYGLMVDLLLAWHFQ